MGLFLRISAITEPRKTYIAASKDRLTENYIERM
jgi:hypothetical protein